jgi:hypothetical protein
VRTIQQGPLQSTRRAEAVVRCRFIDRTNLKPILSPILDVTCNILVVGYGQSSLGEDLYDM